MITVQTVTTSQILMRTQPDEMLISIENIQDAVSIAATHIALIPVPWLRCGINDNLVERRNAFQQVEEERSNVRKDINSVVFVVYLC